MNIVTTIVLTVTTLLGVTCARANIQDLEHAPDSICLKEAFEDKFFIGTALNLDQIWEQNTKAVAVVKKQFNSIVAENCMKASFILRMLIVSQSLVKKIRCKLLVIH